ncbi:KIAA1841 [Branchiostoma lanceolatum]|uniref:KIAA1841 protein n=1 Tax=Branchiostoma lanceolatum TaxID=7740 RepID=A0A8K0EF11_BRALA|nr:KIAA1841 [Branchiostoma lanceolatum]
MPEVGTEGSLVLDVLLKTCIGNQQLKGLLESDPAQLTKLVPKVSAQTCSARYNELSQVASCTWTGARSTNRQPARKPKTAKPNAAPSNNQKGPTSAQPNQAKVPGGAAALGDIPNFPLPHAALLPEPHGANMVIHVCDEAKNLKQDFSCPRDLLVQEMQYFAEYLSTDAQRWEEVDISVHCDVHIFDWLMRYVKRHSPREKDKETPKLEPNNVISILISSDFLKMASLVEECIEYCHQNMSAIVSTPCNMNCISDPLITRIAATFDHNEADEIKDRKDKIKSKIFCKKIESLFQNNGVTLFRCHVCKRVLTQDMQMKIKCFPTRMSINSHGAIAYRHSPDANWDVNDYIISMHNELKSWRDVYWRLWGMLHYLQCSRCKKMFPCVELSHCQFHMEQPQYPPSGDELSMVAVGVYACCNSKAMRFDPSGLNNGCRTRDHVVNFSNNKPGADHEETSDRVLEDLLLHKDAVCVPFKPSTRESRSLETLAQVGMDYLLDGNEKTKRPIFPDNGVFANRQHSPDTGGVQRAFTPDDESVNGSDDEVGDSEQPRTSLPRVIVKKGGNVVQTSKTSQSDKNKASFLFRCRKWDTTRSLRWNQDAQREEDAMRNSDMVSQLAKIHFGTLEKTKKEYAGGIYSKLDAQFRSTLQPSKPTGVAAPLRTRQRPPLR